MTGEIEGTINESILVKEKLKEYQDVIKKIGNMISDCINRGGKVFIFGNGGSAADSQHIAAELVGKYQQKRKGLPAIALTTNSSIITAIGNDFGYEFVFERQIEAMTTSNDIVIGISTSGNSLNVINGILAAKKIGAMTIGLTGQKGRRLEEVADIILKVPSDNTQRIQECHIMIGHIICDIVETRLENRYKS